jgi:hypothetical protein
MDVRIKKIFKLILKYVKKKINKTLLEAIKDNCVHPYGIH